MSNKAPGHDKITLIMLKNCSFKIILQIYYIIRASMQLGYFPKIWKTALVLAFSKPDKSQTSQASYRPISLLSVLSKIYERIIYIQIIKHLESEKIINEQFGFRPRHSTVTQLMRITEHFALEINKKRYTAMILLDLQKAFDLVWHQGLLYKLHLIKILDDIIRILHSYLMDRYFLVNFCGQKSAAYSVDAGVSQGSVLGPMLLFINDIPKSRNSGLAVYADDTTVYTSSWSTALLTRRLQTYVDDILRYFTDWRMSINSDKSKAIVFTRKKYKNKPPPPIRVLNYAIPWSSKVKYLGIILDSGLRWGPAITDRINKITTTFKMLYPLIKVHYTSGLNYYCIKYV